MRIACFESFLEENIRPLLNEDDVLWTPEAGGKSTLTWTTLITNHPFDPRTLYEFNPDIIFSSLPDFEKLPLVKTLVQEYFGKPIPIVHYDPVRLDDVFLMFDGLGKHLKAADQGKKFSARMKAQMMDWSSNFYDRMKNKRVTFILSLDPLMIGGKWIPDMIRMASGHPQLVSGQIYDEVVQWNSIVAFNPDVIVVALKDVPLDECLKSFKVMEKYPSWENIYAVKRGDVYFTDGTKYFNKPTADLLESMGVLVSAMAGFESGYITPRDSMYKLRWLEMQRHRF